MDTTKQKAKEIFLSLVDSVAEGELERRADEACHGDPVLRQRVRALLMAHADPDSRLEQPAGDVPRTADSPRGCERPGTIIGPYKLLQELGEGGMGVVYLAEQSEPVKRRVALKVIKPGMDSQQVIARFEAERQALALMDHPNIAKVLDAATTESGRPYFVMELVKGIPLTNYCDEQHLTPKERLELFVPVCQAVQHAHQKGIIHRDLKPSNVLVALYDGRPVPKVIDFGVAKATSQQLTEKTMFTAVGQIVGTLEYMSPEQAQVNQLDVDTRSDIYSLGVLLYELLTGATPLDRKRLRSAALDEMMRIIREEEPPRPSVRLSTIDTLPSIAANRRIEPRKLRTLVRGELDWIVMKALEKDRSRRYETANGFALDIQRYLDNEPVVACPPSAQYRFRKFARRNKAALMTASVVIGAILSGLVGTTWQAIRAQRERDRAVAAERAADAERNTAQQERDRARIEEVRATSETARANQQLRLATAMRFAAQAQAIKDESPVQSLLLAIEAIETTRRHDGTVLPVAHETLLSTAAEVGGLPLLHHEGTIYSVPMSPDGRWLVTIGGSLGNPAEVWLFDLTAADIVASARPLIGHSERVWSAAISANSRWLVTGGTDNTARVWDLSAPDPAPSSTVLFADAEVGEVAISSDGRWVLAGGVYTSTAQLWDLRAADPNASSFRLPHAGNIPAVAIAANDRWAVTGSEDTTTRLWDLTATDPATSSIVLEGHEDYLRAVAISPDGHWLITGSDDKTVRIWDLSAADIASASRVLRGHEGGIRAMAVDPSGRWLVTASQDNTARVWDLTAEDPSVSSLELYGHTNQLLSVAIGPNARWVVTGSDDENARLWDLAAEDPAASSLVLPGHEYAVTAVSISPENGRWLVTASRSGTARLWDLHLDNPASPFVLRGHRDAVSSLATSKDGRWLATGGLDGEVRLWDLSVEDQTISSVELPGHADQVSSVAISPDNRWLSTGSHDGTARVWDLSDPTAPPRVLPGAEGRLKPLAIGSRVLATGDFHKTARLWDLTTADPLSSMVELPGYQSFMGPLSPSLAISPDGRWLATTLWGKWTEGPEHTVRLWDLSLPDPVSARIDLPVEHGIVSLSISPDSRWLVTANWVDYTVRVWDLFAAEPALSYRVLSGHKGGVMASAVSPNGRWLVTGGYDSTVRLWDLTAPDSTSSSRELCRNTTGTYSVVISPDGRWVVACGWESTVRAWDLDAADPVASTLELRGQGDFPSLAFTRDSRRVITGGRDKMVRLWDLDVDALIQRTRHLAGRELTVQERTQYMIDGP